MNNCYVEINKDIIKSNIENILTKYDTYKYYIGVVKGNAYGHGMEIVKTMESAGINYFAVSTLEEGIEVRKYTDCGILCLQPIDIEELKIASENDIAITISNYDYFTKIKDKHYNLKVHIKIDSGMNRLGINNERELLEIYDYITSSKNYELVGIYTHLATLGIVDKKWDNQVNNFVKLTKNIDLEEVPMVHIYSSNSLVMHPRLKFDNAVRIGILMYGVVPNPVRFVGLKGKLKSIKYKLLQKKYNISRTLNDYSVNVKPAFKFISKVIEIKDVKKDEYIGYGLKYKTTEDCKVAIVPVGYMDGLSLKNTGRNVLINDKKYQIVGSINMKMITVIVNNDVKVGDKVIVIGNNIKTISSYTGVTPHVLMTSISKDIKRVYK